MSEKKLFVKKGGRVPQDVVQVISRTAEEVAFFPVGGGFQYHMLAGQFDATHREVTSGEYDAPLAYAATYGIDDVIEDLPGYSFGRRWNGWACPYFPKESCDRIAQAIGKGAHFDADAEAHVIPYDTDSDQPKEFDRYPAQTIRVEGQELKVWAIGNGCWTWEEQRE
jgi:hypothetical protein